MTDTSTQGQTPPPRGTGVLDDALHRLRTGDIHRDTDRRWFGGVCAGIAARFDVDPLLIRAAAIALTIAGGLGIPVYLVLWLLLPDAHGTVLAERALRHGDAWPVVLGVVTALFLVGGLVSLGAGGDGWGGPIWLLIPVGLVVWLLATRSRPGGYQPPPAPPAGRDAPYAQTPYGPPRYGQTPPVPSPGGPPMSAPTSSSAPPYGGATPPPPAAPPRPWSPPPAPAPRRRRPSGFVGLVSLGLAIGLVGLGVALAGPLGFPGEPALLGFTLALAGVSAVVLGLGISGRASGFSGFLALGLTVITLFGVLVAHSPASPGIGDRTWSPTAATLPGEYALGVGDAVLDLGAVPTTAPAGGPALVTAEVGAGTLTVTVPAGLDVRIEAKVGLGEIRHERSGPTGTQVVSTQAGDDRSYSTTIGDGTPDVVVRTEVGLGDIVIEEN